jgi:hypothetical protein
LTNWIREFRKYHRDDKGSGKIVKRDDHLMDAVTIIRTYRTLAQARRHKTEHPHSIWRTVFSAGADYRRFNSVSTLRAKSPNLSTAAPRRVGVTPASRSG